MIWGQYPVSYILGKLHRKGNSHYYMSTYTVNIFKHKICLNMYQFENMYEHVNIVMTRATTLVGIDLFGEEKWTQTLAAWKPIRQTGEEHAKQEGTTSTWRVVPVL